MVNGFSSPARFTLCSSADTKFGGRDDFFEDDGKDEEG